MASQEYKDIDLAVIGASFSGLQCAKAAAARGLRVVVLDRKKEPGANLRTTGILVKEAAEEIDFPAHLGRRVPGIRLYDSKFRGTDFSSRGYYFVATNTAGLLRSLADSAALAGTEFIFGTPITRFESQANGDCYLLPEVGIRCRFLVGADGAGSRVARGLGLSQNSSFLYGAEVELPLSDALDPRYLHCFVSRTYAPGYIAWALAGPEVMQVGLASSKPDPLKLEPFLEEFAKRFDVDVGQTLSRRAGRIPCGGILANTATPRAMLVGDAAGWVSPLTAGGIEPSLRLGRRTGQAVYDYLEWGGVHPEEVIKSELPGFGLKKWMRRAANLKLSNRVMDAALGTASVKAIAEQIYFHQRGNAKGEQRLSPGPLDWAAWGSRQEPGSVPGNSNF